MRALPMALALGALLALPAQAQSVRPLFDVLAECEAYVTGDPAAFAGLPTEVDAANAAIRYGRIETDEGWVTVKLFDNMASCWTYGALFTDDGRRTTVPWDGIQARMMESFAARATDPITLQIVEGVGGSVQFCEGNTVVLRVAATGGGTDDPERALTFSASGDRHQSTACP